MWLLLSFVSFLAIILFAIIGGVALFRKKGTVKRNFLITGAAFVLFIIAVVNSAPETDEAAADEPTVTVSVAESPSPSITEEDKASAPVSAESSAEPTTSPESLPTEAPAVSNSPAESKSGNWKIEIKDLAGSGGSPTEKADAAESLARKYQAGEAELKEFQDQLINEFISKKYLSQIDNADYMLANIFKSVVVNRANDGAPIGDFAYDFYQNTKYTYRGADSPDSESVKSNEEQMKKALAKLK